MRIGSREFDTDKHTYIMGILNATPDSFSDGGRYSRLDKALYRVEEMLSEGMDILDVGGESTRPGHIPVPAEEEMKRVLPLLEAVRKRFDVPLSLDTRKASVALEGIRAGVDLINDVGGLRDKGMGELIAESGVACCLVHNREETLSVPSVSGEPEAACRNDGLMRPSAKRRVVPDTETGHFALGLPAPGKNPIAPSPMEGIREETRRLLERAKETGIQKGRILLDPGIGFGKTYEENLMLISRIGELRDLGCPLLLGASRKSVIGLTLDLPPEERLAATLATGVFGILQGCAILRVHDVKAHVQAVKMTEALLGYKAQG